VVGSVPAQLLKTWGAAVDLKLTRDTYLGFEVVHFDADVRRQRAGLFHDEQSIESAVLPFTEQLDYSAWLGGVNLHQLLGQQWSFGLGWRWHEATLDRSTPGLTQLVPDENKWPGRHSATLQELWGRLQWQHPCGPFGRLDTKFLWQSHHEDATRQPVTRAFSQHENVAEIDLQIGFRFPKNRGEISCGILNVGGGDYRLAPLSGYPELPHERVFSTRLQLNF
jgi:hypothetical protein